MRPPIAPAMIVAGRMTHTGPGSDRATHVAAIAPTTIWPSTPMFHRPAANVTTSPADARRSGDHASSVADTFEAEPNEPLTRSHRASNGGAPARSSSTMPKARAAARETSVGVAALKVLTLAPSRR